MNKTYYIHKLNRLMNVLKKHAQSQILENGDVQEEVRQLIDEIHSDDMLTAIEKDELEQMVWEAIDSLELNKN